MILSSAKAEWSGPARARQLGRWRLLVLTSLLSIGLVGCQSPGGGQRWVRSEVHFGLARPDGSMITAAEWQAFVDEVVTPRFPAGLSIVDTTGQWRDRQGQVVHEPSKMLVLLHQPGIAIEAAIDEIRRQYCRRFDQEAVMKVTTKARVAF